ncbi:hypothetical protein BU24DRAFT_415697 [Aaosphaeria arxii CBS 175.79]|uniref:Uncharacterized protein n=1 Tax=Aaosphaeria arxii CBS 175.79 TaxID=1450172 RepID=A0A6A5X6Q5_9PLEO|nr:uncharacterized protein BU24DRAFT_415697 [Aaosphaeria arxii CBS 175.79]KAF2008643.1 hypothetical protein BU24DRAFT_415697 [Aaosphaeria arxii CBS 175.79]
MEAYKALKGDMEAAKNNSEFRSSLDNISKSMDEHTGRLDEIDEETGRYSTRLGNLEGSLRNMPERFEWAKTSTELLDTSIQQVVENIRTLQLDAGTLSSPSTDQSNSIKAINKNITSLKESFQSEQRLFALHLDAWLSRFKGSVASQTAFEDMQLEFAQLTETSMEVSQILWELFDEFQLS